MGSWSAKGLRHERREVGRERDISGRKSRGQKKPSWAGGSVELSLSALGLSTPGLNGDSFLALPLPDFLFLAVRGSLKITPCPWLWAEPAAPQMKPCAWRHPSPRRLPFKGPESMRSTKEH